MDAIFTSALQIVLAAIFGIMTPLIIKWIETRRNKTKVIVDNSNEIATAADKTAEAAGKIVSGAGDAVELWRTMLTEQRTHYEKVVQTAIDAASQECNKKIETLKDEYGKMIATLTKDNISLVGDIAILKQENLTLSINSASLTERRNQTEKKLVDMEQKLLEFKQRLAKYENGITGDALKKEKEQNSK